MPKSNEVGYTDMKCVQPGKTHSPRKDIPPEKLMEYSFIYNECKKR